MENLVATSDGCLEWSKCRNPKGYGIVAVHRHARLAHRVAYAEAFGPIPTGMQVRHTCDNPPCCNPAHLVLGTQKDNMGDKSARGRASYNHKLTVEQVDDLNGLRSLGWSQQKIADYFGISQSVVGDYLEKSNS